MSGLSEAPDSFVEPWQVAAYAMSQALINAGMVSPEEWTAALHRELRQKLNDEGAQDSTETYSTSVVEALAIVATANGLLTEEELEKRIREWRHAYEMTPHGTPVRLE